MTETLLTGMLNHIANRNVKPNNIYSCFSVVGYMLKQLSGYHETVLRCCLVCQIIATVLTYFRVFIIIRAAS